MNIKDVCKFLKGRKSLFLLMVFLLISFICLIKRENIVEEPIASNFNSEIGLILDNTSVLKQSWQASKKKIMGITVSTQNGEQLSGKLKLYFSEGETLEEAIIGPLELSLESNASNELIFLFKKPVTVKLGERYNIFLVGNSTESSTLRIDSNSNHYGCFIDNTDTNQAAGINIKYAKTSKIGWIYIVCLLILSYSIGFMLLFKKEFADVVGMAIAAIGVVIYLFGILGILKFGIWVSIIGALLLIVFEFYYILKNNINLSKLFSPSVFIWMLVFFLIILHNQNVSRGEWDEFSHWGLTVKDMFFSDSFSNYPGTNTLITIYPPFVSMFQYLFIYINGVFSEAFLYIAYQLTALSFMWVLLKNVSLKIMRTAIVGTLMILTLPLLFFINFYCTIYVDAILGIITAYIFVCYLMEELKLFNLIRISLGVFALVMTKETGVVLAGIMVLLMCGDTIYKNKKIFTKESKKIFLVFLFLLISFASWQIYMSTSISKIIPDLVKDNNELIETSTVSIAATAEEVLPILSNKGIDMSEVINVLKGLPDQNQIQIIKNYITHIFSYSEYSLGMMEFSAMGILFTLLLVSLIIAFKGWIGANSKVLYRGILGMVYGGIGYLFFLLLTYLFIFKRSDMFLSHNRYAGSYLLAAFIVFVSVIFIGLTETREGGKGYKLGILLMVMLLIVPIEGVYMKPEDRSPNPDVLYGYDEIEETFRGFADKSDRVYFVCNGSNGYSNLVFLNAIVPIHSDYPVPNLHTDGKGSTSVKEWKEKLQKDYQYVFILHADYKFKMQYQEIFENIAEITDGSIFKVTKTEDNVFMLRKIGNVNVKGYV